MKSFIEPLIGISLPRYKCHKEVWALKIKSIEIRNPTIDELETILKDEDVKVIGAIITPQEDGYEPFTVTRDYMMKHEPEVGGYYVVYKDGYQSYSPAKAFEEGYTIVQGEE